MTIAQRAYLAGLIDGEGYIYFRKRIEKCNGRSKWWGGVQINITNKEIIDVLCEWVGGSKVFWRAGQFDGKRMQRYRWEISSRQSDRLVKSILPFLIIKKDNAKLYLKFRKTFYKSRLEVGRGHKLKDSVFNLRINLLKEYRDLMKKQTMRKGGHAHVNYGLR